MDIKAQFNKAKSWVTNNPKYAVIGVACIIVGILLIRSANAG